MKKYIYCLKDPLTKEIKYVGCTSNIKRRLSQHLNEAKINRNKNRRREKWINSLLDKKLKPIIEIIKVVYGDIHNIKRQEWELIIEFDKKGTKLLNGDGGEIPYYFTQLRKVYQYDKNSFRLIKEFRCAYEAYTKTGIKDGNITSSCKSIESKKVKFAGNFLWSYEKYNIFPKEKLTFSIRYNKKKIKAISISTNTSYIFESAREAAKNLNCSYKQISACCLGNQKIHNNYKFSFV